jgi:hypothetical protein
LSADVAARCGAAQGVSHEAGEEWIMVNRHR